MSTKLFFDFYASNAGTSYPFGGPADAFTRNFVDAVVSLPDGVPNEEAVLTKWSPTGGMEVKVGDTTVIPFDAPVTAQVFGDYVIHEARTPTAQVTLVFAAGAQIPEVTSGAYAFQGNAVSRATAAPFYFVVDGQEIAGPGQPLQLAAGANMSIEGADFAGASSEILLGAAFKNDGAPQRLDGFLEEAPAISTINGISPDKHGNFFIEGAGTYVVGRTPGTFGVTVTNVGEPCCDCPDYIAVHSGLDETTQRLDVVAKELSKAQDAYRQLLAYARFLLQAPIVGGVGPGEEDRVAQL